MSFLFFVFFLLPLTVIIFAILVLMKEAILVKAFGIICLSVFALVILSALVSLLSEKKVLTQKDYYGEYVIDRSYFPGRQANWQYQNFHFVIKPNDSIYFYSTPSNGPARV